MTIRYVGIGGNDGNSGLTWALRKLTLNGAEDTPVVAGDDVYVGPGTYREKLICDVNGGVGNYITYIGDVTGEHTDDVGGIVRITGSDNDQTAVRDECIECRKNYRTFRGFRFDMPTSISIDLTGGPHFIEDCVFINSTGRHIITDGASQNNNTIRRCFFTSGKNDSVLFRNSLVVDDAGHLVENCIFVGWNNFGRAVKTERIGGIIVRNSLFLGNYESVAVTQALTVGQTVTVNNCIFDCNRTALNGTVAGEIVEDFNTFFNNTTDRTNTNVGANSVAYPSLLSLPLLHSGASQISGFKFPWWFGELSEWSQIAAITGANEPTEELRGIARPVTASKNSWGATQFFDSERETGTVRTGSVSIVLHDAGRHQIWVPVTATSTTILIYVYREANYAGNLPQMIIKQPGQADDVTTDVGGAGGWNLLTTTLTPAADPPYVVVELVSRNTAVALAFNVFFDDLDVS